MMRHLRRFIRGQLYRIGIKPTEKGGRRWWVLIALIGIASDAVSILTLGAFCAHWRGDAMFGRNAFSRLLDRFDPDNR